MPISNVAPRPVGVPTVAPKSNAHHRDLGHKVGDFFKELGEDAFDTLAKTVGVVELIGVRYPVEHYQSKVSDGLTRGSRLESRKDYEDLKARGFKAIVDLTMEGTNDQKYAKAAGLNTLNIKILDNDAPSMAQMKQFLDFVTKPENQPAYVHCQAGKGRTGVAVAVYRLAVLHEPLDRVMADAKKFGMSLPGQQEFVQKFEKALREGKVEGYTRW